MKKYLIPAVCVAMLIVGAALGVAAAILKWAANRLASTAEDVMSRPPK